MIDLFNFIKELLRNEPELIAAFLMGIIVALVFLSSMLYWFFSKRFSGDIADLMAKLNEAKEDGKAARDQLKDARGETDDLQKKHKERKRKIEEQEKQLHQTAAALTSAEQAALDQKLREENANKALQDAQGKFAEAQKQIAQWKSKHDRLYARAHAKLKSYIEQTTALKKQVAALNDQAKLIEKLQGQLWDVPADKNKIGPFRPLRKNGTAIIAVTNLKGGVGKTTLTANLAATFCSEMAKRVLVIDLDFQASLTNLCLTAESVEGLKSGSGRLIDNVFNDWAADLPKLAFSNLTQTREPKLHLLAASENLANVEERSKVRWLMNQDGPDLRCVLRSALHDPLFQDTFDVILIDCPPRWTTSSINAIACCDYVLIPTQLDRVSSEAVPRLLSWLRNLKSSSVELYGQFGILGVVGNLADPRQHLIAQERTIWESLPAKCVDAWGAPVYHFDTIIRDKSEVRRAANNREFAALVPVLTPAFLELANEVEKRRSAHA